ncbi:GNAT family N-acetyltransferase [Planctomycetota bacterium]
MDPIREYIDIRMSRENLDNIPEDSLLSGYSIRWYQPGYEEYWQAVQTLADEFTRVTPDLFEEQFGTDTQLLSERQCFLCDSEENIIGTATAWLDNHDGKSLGRIHWLAIIPQQQGNGLAKPLLTIICNRLKELGHRKTYLTTQSVRIPAINLYAKFGFAPVIDSDRDREIWEKLQKHIKYPLSF